MRILAALSIVAPHGENIAAGRKTVEVRSWQPPTLPIEDLLIVENSRLLTEDGQVDPDGVAVALVDVVSVAPWLPDEVAAACSAGWQAGYFSWRLGNVRPFSQRVRVPAARKLYEVHLELASLPR
ncbi:ASCH domain-containing protein [Piscinibacter gummiphilus]|uniref:RNA-binding protein n=1 Tax=Piscinibacter gummiphilus TaxID=946333 RepID=A0A1W6L6H5_9BURK|nr:ASCH domain-containing protein [Piscinibacter gummiphilus]ARN19780.1 RNA-binding protein [Piscinibacter gummiphilus]ATU64452.1 ASCH domain-containing protein [Piscinibacter gummiphilus]GLS95146.1 RNA-binding protein [Piscinibacter gummiphilus]